MFSYRYIYLIHHCYVPLRHSYHFCPLCVLSLTIQNLSLTELEYLNI